MCILNVSRTIPDSYLSITDALNVYCPEDGGVLIMMLDAEHNEHLEIMKDLIIIITVCNLLFKVL